jgi:hypothetical protein
MGEPRAAIRVFAYGTLLQPAVLRAVTGRAFALRPARLPGFARYRLHGEVFPAIVAEPGAITAGALLEGVGPTVLAELDRYEGELYRRCAVVVERGVVPVERAGAMMGMGERVGAQVYVLAPAHRHRLAPAAWEPERFAAEQLGPYLARCQRRRAAPRGL